MGHKHVFESIDRTMQDIRKKSSPFGGLTVLLAGDWRHILQVVRHGSRPDIVDAMPKSFISVANRHKIAADTKHEGKATRRVFTICRFPS